MTRKQDIARRFGGAASAYDRSAGMQRVVAARLARLILSSRLPAQPRILEIGCGTGLLTDSLRAALPDAEWILTDLSTDMLSRCRDRFPAQPRMRFVAMDAEAPAVGPGFDLICGSLAMQWFEDRAAAVSGLASLLNPGGILALSTLCASSFSGWRAALEGEAVADTMPRHASLQELQADWPGGGAGHWQSETLLDRHARGIDFLRGLRAIGADLPRPDAAALEASALRRVLHRFESEHGAVADYQIGYGIFRRAAREGVFVTGTDTGIGKTLVSACLARAWGADYWKPLQTGLACEPGDTQSVMQLAGLDAGRVVPPLHELQAPLSPQAAAELEGVVIDPGSMTLPEPSGRPLVVEGAGGLMVPVDGDTMMIDLIRRLAMPVVLVARGTLGTINHTLLSLEALRARGLPVAGVILNGDATAGNRDAIARHGKVRILAELPRLRTIDPAAVDRLALLIPKLASLR